MRNLATWLLANALVTLVTVVEAMIVSISEIYDLRVGKRVLTKINMLLLRS